MTKKMLNWIQHAVGLLISIAIAEGVGILSSFFTRGTMEKYQQLVQPSFSPPGWVFSIVWSVLFLLMGIASYRVYNAGIQKPVVKNALIFYTIQLIFNFFWTIIFFRLELRGFAFVWLIILWVLIIITTVKFYKIDKIAGYLMVPYILWVSFAGLLNYSIWQLNK
ncbi:TspO/MBR family protein [Petroclostridium sp. X23]|uniref:TspO/MBR family protein n=1 Tax=Petroclostridium sp. X23 TaxID=3045146 RepID=UPI0024ACC8CE|nr:TspO/MBR family protein [Petroclostridium sp. X23]WHH57811.1 tryptophan-rich sensory protein [Petroclostridium sp. X23]